MWPLCPEIKGRKHLTGLSLIVVSDEDAGVKII